MCSKSAFTALFVIISFFLCCSQVKAIQLPTRTLEKHGLVKTSINWSLQARLMHTMHLFILNLFVWIIGCYFNGNYYKQGDHIFDGCNSW